MARVSTTKTGISYAIESALGVIPTADWRKLEPNTFSRFGANVTTTARTPISLQRDRRKGTITDQDSGVEIEGDLTLSHIRDFTEGFAMADATNSDLILKVTAVNATNSFTLASALTATQAGKTISTAKVASLFYLRGVNSANGGLRSLNTQPAAASANLMLGSDSSAQTNLRNAQAEIAGVRGLANQRAFTWDWDPATLTATLRNAATGTFNWNALGLSVGQYIHIGSLDGTTVTNAFRNVSSNDMYGLARIKSVNGLNLVCDKVDPKLQFDHTMQILTTVDILFGQFIRTVSIADAAFLEQSYSFEQILPDLGGIGTDMYEYSRGNYCNQMSFNIPLADKATVTFGFEGTTTDRPTRTRAGGAANALTPLATAPFNTSADIARLRLDNIDNSGLSTDFKSLTLTLNNNVSGEKKLGTLGPAFMNIGLLNVDIEAQLIFTEAAVVEAIRCNTTVTMDFALSNSDGGLIVDIPNLTLAGGEKEYPENESVLLNTTAQAFLDENSNYPYSIGISLFPHLPTTHVC